ncbi:nuclease-related domain-containing protein [Arenimonas fontis]|uniref:Nuclease n=1 Tax=Arenimonas fontis TaxID=2608255 RepID=A0A5B2ZB08_9GAMM|nr:NERD domain-containing protein [Arenimonas fontis]KAA2284733.1 nuclease [Arenimonas fontis]
MPVLESVLSVAVSFWWLWLIALLILLLRVPAIKGWFGERLVEVSLRLSLPSDVYQVCHDITLPTQDGSTQVDHVVVSPYGVFVVETKNMRGWIFGSERDAWWTQKIYRRSHRFQNPLRQSFKHVAVLRELLELPENAVISVVVFVGGSEFKTPMPPNVTYGLGLVRFIKSHTTPVLSAQQVPDILQRLDAAALAPGRETRKQHVARLRERLDGDACPRCGKALVERTARKGMRAGQRFLGCSGYPACRYTRQIAS